MTLQIKRWPDPILLTPCQPWNFDSPPQTVSRSLTIDLLTTMAENGGIGLAANQVGIPYRVMAIHIQSTDERIVMYNPELTEIGQEPWEHPEGCLSFPGVELLIARAKTVTVKYQDENRTWHTRQLDEIDAKCVQHEIDHLDGKTFKDYVSPLKFGRAVDRGRKRK